MDQIQGGGIVFRLMQGVKICLKSEPNRKLGIEFADYNRTVTHEVTYPNNVKLSIQEICPSIFGDIREMNKISQISLLKEWDIPQDKLTASESSGKSGSIFILSNEKSFMIKSIEKREEKLLLRMIHDYHQHLVTNPQSLLMKVLAFYSIKNTISRESYIMFNNLLKINVSIDEKYDLKGSTKDREASKVERAKAVPCLLDNDFIAAQRKLHFGPVKAEFMKQLVADSSLLCRFDSMDYSFLVGIHKVKPEDKEFVQSQKSSIFYNSPLGDKVCTIISSDKTEIYFVGVIDIFTFYDAEKRVANAAKSVKYSEDSLSTVNAQKYSSRFCTFVDSIID
uniref:PIPK domain-containing protein n=1 Tax=Arcella intermedia TaxID=1963864 RepID=A0A6B2L7T9_9EUKA